MLNRPIISTPAEHNGGIVSGYKSQLNPPFEKCWWKKSPQPGIRKVVLKRSPHHFGGLADLAD